MQIVIDIDDWMYSEILKGVKYQGLEHNIKNGTPLPKGHGRLIDADKAELIARETKTDSDARIIRSYLKSVPTVIGGEIERWRWIDYRR